MAQLGGFNKDSGNQSAQKVVQQGGNPKQSIPMNCFIVNQLRAGKLGTSSPNSPIYDWDLPFEVAIITARYTISNDESSSKIEGTLSDPTGSFQVLTYKKETDDLPEFLQKFQIENSANKPIYVRAVLKLKKQQTPNLLSFSIVKDANEITRHNLDIALRYMFRTKGPEILQGAAPSARKDANSTKKVDFKVVINPSLDQKSQVLSYFTQVAQRYGCNTQISLSDIAAFFQPKLNSVQLKNIIKELVGDDKIINIPPTDMYFLAD